MAERRRRLLHPALAMLTLRRSASGTLVVLALAAALVTAFADWTPALPALDEGARPAVLRGLAREAAWTAALLALVPALALHGGSVVGRWRKGEGDWLGSRPTSRTAALASTWLGASAGAALLVLATGAVVEASSGAAPSWRAAGTLGPPAYQRLAPGAALAFELDLGTPPLGSRLAAQVLPGAGATGQVRFEARRADDTAVANAPVSSRTWVELALPAGEGPVQVRVVNEGESAVVLAAPDAFRLWTPGGSERRASLAIGGRAALLLTTLLALAMGLGAWLGTAAAAGGAVTLWLLGAWVSGSSGWWPGADLTRALGVIGEGRLPAVLDPWAVPVALACAVLGGFVGRAGLSSWRHAP